MQDKLDQRSRLISLVYQVLSIFPQPREGAPDAEVYSQLGSAFYRKAVEVADDTHTNGRDSQSPGDPGEASNG
jgi:hypothetical protein